MERIYLQSSELTDTLSTNMISASSTQMQQVEIYHQFITNVKFQTCNQA